MNAAAEKNSLKNASVLSGAEAISGCEKASAARQTGANARRLNRGPFDVIFASGVTLALWTAIIFILVVLF